jgi:hypothetical protein
MLTATRYKDSIASTKNLTGKVFGRITVLEFARWTTGTRQPRPYWKCKCNCGRVWDVLAERLGKVTACRSCTHSYVDRTICAFNYLYGSYKYRAKIRGFEWNINKEQFRDLTSRICYYCDSKPIQISKSGTSRYI